MMLPDKLLARSFHSSSASVPVDDLLVCHFTVPPALKKLRNAVLLAKVTVCVNVMVQAVVPDPVVVVLLVVPVNIPYSVPCAAALGALFRQLVISVATLAKMVIVLPATGAVRLVNVVA